MLRKKNDNIFKIPLQGKYLKDVKENKTSSYYSDQKIGSGIGKNQLSDNLKSERDYIDIVNLSGKLNYIFKKLRLQDSDYQEMVITDIDNFLYVFHNNPNRVLAYKYIENLRFYLFSIYVYISLHYIQYLLN